MNKEWIDRAGEVEGWLILIRSLERRFADCRLATADFSCIVALLPRRRVDMMGLDSVVAAIKT